MDINELLNRRTDLSTFLVHLTRAGGGHTARQNLESILGAHCIQARSIYGHLKAKLAADGVDMGSQKTVCFTETPLEYSYLMLEEIPDRDVRFEPYGVALTKRLGRERGVNPVWYVDISPGHDWLTKNLNSLADQFLAQQEQLADLAKIFPFVEHMGNGRTAHGGGYRKEFWLEREWRHIGNFNLPARIICLCPEEEFAHFGALMQELGIDGPCLDPRWSLEHIIARLAGYSRDQVQILRND